MVDDVKDIIETAEASQEVLDRARLARERREAEQRKRLDELRAHAAAAQAQREKRDEDRRKRQADQRARDDDRRIQVEERKRAIWEASISRREALLQRERDRSERLDRQRAARSAPRPAFAFGSSTPRLLEPIDSAGFFWAARSTNPIDQVNFFESLAASTTNVMFASAPLTRRASALQLDISDGDNKDEPDRQLAPLMWSSVARRRTDLVPTVPAPRSSAPGRAYSMTRLDRLPHSPQTHVSRTQTRSGETTPGSRPGSALSNATGVVRRPSSAPRKPRPASIAGTGVNTPRGGIDVMSQSVATTPSVSRDSTLLGEVPRRPLSTPRRPRPASLYASAKPATLVAPGEGKPPVHRKPKPSKEHDKSGRGKCMSASPGRGLSRSPSPSPRPSKEPSLDKDVHKMVVEPAGLVSAAEVTHKLEALQIHNGGAHTLTNMETNESHEAINTSETKIEAPELEPKLIETQQENTTQIHEESIEKEPIDKKDIVDKKEPVEKKDKPEKKEENREEKREERKEPSQEKTEEADPMTASMVGRRITTEEQAKAALAERRRRAREELERQADLERQRLQREAEEDMERQRLEEERQRREEEEARELARLQRSMEEEKLRKAIEAQQQLEREEAERKAREEADKQARVKEDEEKRRAAEEGERQRREEAEREEKERLARKQRVEAIMQRTRLRKAEEDKKQQDNKQNQPAPTASPRMDNGAVPTPAPRVDNGNVVTDDLLGFNSSQVEVTQVTETNSALLPGGVELAPAPVIEPANNGNHTADLLGLSQPHNTEDKIIEQPIKQVDNTPPANNGNGDAVHHPANAGQPAPTPANDAPHPANLSANFIQNEIATNEAQKLDKLLDDDFTTHNGHNHTHPLTLQNAI